MHKVYLIDTGLRKYSEMWNFQKSLFEEVNSSRNGNFLIFTEHPPVITIGKSGKLENIVTDQKQLTSEGIDFFKIDRGGDATFHGPGQIVCYPIFNLNEFKKDINWYLRSLEEIIILTLEKYGIKGSRIAGLTGVWVENNKICAIGVKISRWITMHGFALNVNTDLSYFKNIVPCGIANKGVTSMAEQLDKSMSIELVKMKLIHYFKEIFELDIENREYVE